MFRYRSQRIALAVSILIHLCILLLYGPLAKVRLFPVPNGAAVAEEAKPLVFELVETPADAIRQRPEDARLLSDKNALARDEYTGDDRERGDPYSEGRSPYRVFAGELEAADARHDQQPKAQADPSARESPDGPAGIDPGGSSGNDGAPRREAPREAAEDYLSAEAARSSLSMRRLFSDDIDFDQRRFSAENLGDVSLSTYEWDYAYYILEMKRKIRSNIYPPAAFTLLGIISGEAVLRFRVQPDGSATDVAVVVYRGDRSLMETSLDAVQLSSPFRPLPADFPDEYLELTWTFIYTVYR